MRTKLLIAGLFAVVAVYIFVTVLNGGNYVDVSETDAAAPGWITSCNYTHSNNDDPIVFPNQPGLAHTHDFIGSTVTNAFTTTGSAVRAGGTTCTMTDDHSAYWVPALFKNNERVLPKGTSKHALFYYRRKAPSGVTVQPFPDGLRMILGNQKANMPAENKAIASGNISFKCGPGSNTEYPQPPAQCSSGIMVIIFTFPNCWNGKDLDSMDHLSHMSYMSGSKCPSTHPVYLPRLQGYFRYPVGTAPIGNVTLASGPYYTAHMDFFNAWNPAGLKSFVDKCMNGNIDCGTNPTMASIMRSPTMTPMMSSMMMP